MHEIQLADPDDRHPADIVIWDGKCAFCRSQVERLAAWDTHGKLAYLSLHDPRARTVAPELSPERLMEQMWVITPQGGQFGGADAVRYLSTRLPSLWWLRPILHIPYSMPLWQSLYRLVAKRRYAISGRTCENGSCDLHRQ
ncbi:MAG: DUF393 domain-containing protein [Planctomycetales bacterium]|nr:DUF393 domain-containing protein [Planctomycetales bacterium]